MSKLVQQQVIVPLRVRPLSDAELLSHTTEVVAKTDEKEATVLHMDKKFRFSRVLGPETDQETFFNRTLKPVLTNIFKGYNVAIVTLGGHLAGKSHTVFGTIGQNRLAPSVQDGLLQRAVSRIFDEMRAPSNKSGRELKQVTISCVELSNNCLRDLLASKKSGRGAQLKIRESAGSFFIPGVQNVAVTSADEVIKHLTLAIKSRRAERRHVVFSLKVYSDKVGESTHTRCGELTFVEIASLDGQGKDSFYGGKDFKKQICLNKELFVLEKVLTALSKQQKHIPYRESKLTRLLQRYFGGNTLTIAVACISPSFETLQETQKTLHVARLASKVKNHIKQHLKNDGASQVKNKLQMTNRSNRSKRNLSPNSKNTQEDNNISFGQANQHGGEVLRAVSDSGVLSSDVELTQSSMQGELSEPELLEERVGEEQLEENNSGVNVNDVELASMMQRPVRRGARPCLQSQTSKLVPDLSCFCRQDLPIRNSSEEMPLQDQNFHQRSPLSEVQNADRLVCSCGNKCATIRCPCRQAKMKCSANSCGCSDLLCKNRDPSDQPPKF